ncbi:hypothetical protein MTR67_047301 [Solanum verrucosum]|uniref:RRM domain-containing protein n=2 Tax=Solanum TaxID=4107 RepID=A0AAF0UZ33_SOLVR|nr:hypothetical protein MTR67_047301 [Solanum verrucosum]
MRRAHKLNSCHCHVAEQLEATYLEHYTLCRIKSVRPFSFYSVKFVKHKIQQNSTSSHGILKVALQWRSFTEATVRIIDLVSFSDLQWRSFTEPTVRIIEFVSSSLNSSCFNSLKDLQWRSFTEPTIRIIEFVSSSLIFNGDRLLSQQIFNGDRLLSQPDERKLYLENVPFDMPESGIEEVFAEFGKVEDVQLLKDPETGHRNGCGFVKFAQVKHAKQAQEILKGELKSKHLCLKISPAPEHVGVQDAGA